MARWNREELTRYSDYLETFVEQASKEDTNSFLGLKYCPHEFSDWALTEDGEGHTHTCGICGTVETQGHSYGRATTIAPTCAAGGYTVQTCSVCGYRHTSGQTEALGHNYGSWTVVTEATETSTGLRQQTCSVCGDVQSRTIPMVAADGGEDLGDEDVPLAELPDEEPPLAEVPDEPAGDEELGDEDVPLGELPEEPAGEEELGDEDVPLAELPGEEAADVPKTGDDLGLYLMLAAASAFGLASLGLKRKEEEK